MTLTIYHDDDNQPQPLIVKNIISYNCYFSSDNTINIIAERQKISKTNTDRKPEYISSRWNVSIAEHLFHDIITTA